MNAEPLTAAQRREVERLTGAAASLKELTTSILALAEKLKGETIERLLSKSDLEVGVEEMARLARRRQAGPA